MLEKINETVEVLVKFKKQKVIPTQLHWQERVYVIKKVNLVHKNRDGNNLIYYFSVSDNTNFFRLAFFTKDLSWRLEELYYEG